jgi:hypothetical protein
MIAEEVAAIATEAVADKECNKSEIRITKSEKASKRVKSSTHFSVFFERNSDFAFSIVSDLKVVVLKKTNCRGNCHLQAMICFQ